MNEINIFQSSVWFALIALNAFFIWKYIHLNKTLKTQKPVIHTFTEKKVENNLNLFLKLIFVILIFQNKCILRYIYTYIYVYTGTHRGK
jgi:hypothetical protein